MQANNIRMIIGYSTVKIDKVSDWYWFYYNYCEIEQQNVHLCYYILNYDENLIFDLLFSYMSFIIIFSQILNQFSLVISVTFCSESVKEIHKLQSPILIYTKIGKYTIHTIYKQITLNSGSITGVSQLWRAIL